MPPHEHSTQTRIFNLDIARILLQCSAIMYEHTSEPLQAALERIREAPQTAPPSQNASVDPSVPRPGEAPQNAVGPTAAEEILRDFTEKLGIKYATVSELNSQTAAFCRCFWHPKEKYIILAFRGTGPTDFIEWAVDFSYEPMDAGDYIRGFGRVHGGFMERVFPRRIQPGARLPYCEFSPVPTSKCIY